MPEQPDAWSVARVRLTIGSVFLIAATFVVVTTAWNLVIAAHRTIGWVVASAIVALLLEPLVRTLQRWVRRGIAIAMTVLGTVLFSGVVVAGVLNDLNQQVEGLKDDLPEAAAAIEEDERFGEAASDFELGARVQDFVSDLDDRISQRAAAEEALDTGPAYFVNVVLVIFFLIFGTRMGEAGLQQIQNPARRERWAAIGVEAVNRGQQYILRSLGVAVVVGSGTGLTAWLHDLPAPAVLGVVMAAFALLPNVGILLGALPVLLLSAGFQPGGTTAALALGFVVTQVVVAIFGHRFIDAPTVRVGPAVVVIVALIGFEVYGFGGTFYGVALAVFGIAALEAATAPGRGEKGEAVSEPVVGAATADRDGPGSEAGMSELRSGHGSGTGPSGTV